MLTQAALLWRFLLVQPWTEWVGLASWHLLAVLVVLGALSAFGLHFLVGHVFGFYRRRERLARWVAWPTLLVFLASLELLLGSYLLGVRAPELVHDNLTTGLVSDLGRILLAPAFKHPLLASQPPDEVPKDAIKTALRTISELDYRNALVAEEVAPSQLVATPESPAAPRGPDVLVQLGLRWVIAPHNAWFGPEPRVQTPPLQPAPPSAPPPAQGQSPAAPGNPAKPPAAAPPPAPPAAEVQPPAQPQAAPDGGSGEQPFFLPDFLASLVDELPAGTVLPRLDWEHVAGTRFVENVLRPLLEEYLTYLALVVAVLVLLVDLLYFLLMARLKRIGQPRAPRKQTAPKALPKPAKGASPDVTPAKPPVAPSGATGPKLPVPAGGAAPPAATGAGKPPA